MIMQVFSSTSYNVRHVVPHCVENAVSPAEVRLVCPVPALRGHLYGHAVLSAVTAAHCCRSMSTGRQSNARLLHEAVERVGGAWRSGRVEFVPRAVSTATSSVQCLWRAPVGRGGAQ